MLSFIARGSDRKHTYFKNTYVRLVALGIVLVFIISEADAAGKIPYGSRSGMQVTVVSMSGLDTSNAKIRTEHTNADAIEFCREYIGKVTDDCIKQELATRLNDEVFANCPRGEFTNFWGDKVRFEGRNRTKGETEPKYVLRDLQSREVADGSSASNYWVNMEIFKALCPKTVPPDYKD